MVVGPALAVLLEQEYYFRAMTTLPESDPRVAGDLSCPVMDETY